MQYEFKSFGLLLFASSVVGTISRTWSWPFGDPYTKPVVQSPSPSSLITCNTNYISCLDPIAEMQSLQDENWIRVL